MQRSTIIFFILFFVLIIAGMNSFFVVNPAEQALIFQFRQNKRIIQNEGFYFKIPFIQDVVYYERRVLPLEPPKQSVTMSEQKIIDVDGFARWRITEPLLFLQTLRSEDTAIDRLGSFFNSSLRNVLGNYMVADLLSNKRDEIVARIKDEMNVNVSRYGVEVVDVRIRDIDLPEETLQNVYNRMRSERQREAAALRADGEKKAVTIRAQADADKTRLLSSAQRDAQKLRGEGDKEAIRIISESMGRDAKFYNFYRSLEAYKNTLGQADTTYLLSPDSDFFKVFSSGRSD